MSPATTAKAEAAAPQMPTFTTSCAISMLWQKSAGKLQTHELEWFATGAAREINRVTSSLSEMLMNIGCLILADDDGTGSFTDAGSASNLMFNLSSQLSTLNGLVDIAADANDRARHAGRTSTSVN